MNYLFPFFVPAIVVVGVIIIVGPKRIKETFRDAWKEMFPIVILFFMTSCYGQQFIPADFQEPDIRNLICVVSEVRDREAILKTKEFEVEYIVDLGKLEPGKEYLFRLLVHPSDNLRRQNAKILGYSITPNQAKKDARQLMAAKY